jgi:nucleotide-binding universal stress UspA family protein
MLNRDLMGIVFSMEEDEPVLAALETLKQRGDQASALLTQLLPQQSALYADAVSAQVLTQLLSQSREKIKLEAEALARRCVHAAQPIMMRGGEPGVLMTPSDVAAFSRLSDLTIMSKPTGVDMSENRIAVFEEVLFHSGKPVLIIPPCWTMGAIGRKIIFGWNGRREAARALGDAVSLFPSIGYTAVVTVNAKHNFAEEKRPGGSVAEYLVRKGIDVEIQNIESFTADAGRIILDEATALEADLIVIGGYGKARLREKMFGGATRTIVRETKVPVLLSH